MLAVAAILAGSCSADESSPVPAGTSSPLTPSTRVEAGPALVDIVVEPGTGTDFVGAIEDVVAQSCRRDPAGWRTEGTVTNSADAGSSYRIYTSFLDSEGALRALLQSDVPAVDPGLSGSWSGTVDLADDNLTCVLRVERSSTAG